MNLQGIALSVLLLFGHAAQSQVINFDVPGGAGDGAVNYSGQGAYCDPGNNYWNPFVLNVAATASTDSDGTTTSQVTLSDNTGDWQSWGLVLCWRGAERYSWRIGMALCVREQLQLGDEHA